MSEKNKTKKRKFKRKSTQVLLNIERISDVTHESSSRAVIQNISHGGANFNCDVAFEKNAEIGMKFIFPNQSVYFFKAVIVRVEKLTMIYSYGVKFIDLDFFDKLKLWKLISKIAID